MVFGEIFFSILEIAGTVSFAISGAMAALEKKVDLFGVIVLGITTALAGGIFRDMLVGRVPPAAFSDGTYMKIAFVTSVIVFLAAWMFSDKYVNNIQVIDTINNIFDAAGLGAFTITGAKVAMSMGYMDNSFFVIFLGMVTGVGGGILRDLMIGEIPFILRKRIYAVASLLGGCIYYVLLSKNVADMTAAFIGIGIVFSLRMLATIFRWNLPKAFK
ncbi:trimeric intracellular cation channel family protein [Frisingicoccus sp.]|uniref:trimeric intracellular cation channel family protein n=1 Tax=Frisingicoccus sp. TaxID=1918627 RepID=UPI0025C2CEA6|nr:trimeric intracellular cation channel family protein [Frisingicoccus sp.]